MPAPYLSQNPLEILGLRLEVGVRVMSPCRAVMGWLANVPTDPFVAAIVVHKEQVALRLSDEPALEPLCSVGDFLDQIGVISQSLHLDSAQTSYLLTRARDLLD